jgi:hypothetical protein
MLLWQITQTGKEQMEKPGNVSRVQKRLRREHRALKVWRAVAEKYGVNVAYIFKLAVYGIEPSGREEEGQEVRYRLGLDVRPKPEWLKMAVEFLREKEQPHPLPLPKSESAIWGGEKAEG